MDDRVTVAVVTYRREDVLVRTLEHLVALDPPPEEVLVVDQTEEHRPETEAALRSMADDGRVRWLRASVASVTRSMNIALREARTGIVLFVDDDVVPDPGLAGAHRRAHRETEARVVVGQILQPGERALPPDEDPRPFRFNSGRRQWIEEVMGGNVSVERRFAIDVGGFDENFLRVAYRFEADFADRIHAAGGRILFEPTASLRHLQADRGGIRSYGDHLRTMRPDHSVGAYYYILGSPSRGGRAARILRRVWRAVRTQSHLRRPWWIPLTILGELRGLIWATRLRLGGPRLLSDGAASGNAPIDREDSMGSETDR